MGPGVAGNAARSRQSQLARTLDAASPPLAPVPPLCQQLQQPCHTAGGKHASACERSAADPPEAPRVVVAEEEAVLAVLAAEEEAVVAPHVVVTEEEAV